MLSRSAARRYVDLGKPSESLGVAALAAGFVSLVPTLAPLAATFAVAAALLGTFLAGRAPERYAGGRKMIFGLLLSTVGMGLFLVEAQVFWRWKVDQAYEARLAVTRYRLSLVEDALGRYRQETGEYPSVTGIMAAKTLLEPKYGALVPTLDAFDGALSVDSRPEGFLLSASPPPRPRTDWTPPPIVVQGGFQPAPTPPPPPEVIPEAPVGGEGGLGAQPPAGDGSHPNPARGPDPTTPKPGAGTASQPQPAPAAGPGAP
jgi:hypothetical protein